MDKVGNIKTSSPISRSTNIIKYAYTGKYQTLNIVKDGKYKIECWGASGGDGRLTSAGNGAYTSGEVNLTKGTALYIYVGQQGKSGVNIPISESWNGGAKAIYSMNTPNTYLTTGGGATDIRMVQTSNNTLWNEIASLSSRIIVAAGGRTEQVHGEIQI
ncbi:Glycine rich protein [compost metagenome]